MTIHVHHKGHTAEVETIKAFLSWQNTGYTVCGVPDMELMKQTKGRGTPVCTHDGVVVAVGFKQLYDYWEKRGLFLC